MWTNTSAQAAAAAAKAALRRPSAAAAASGPPVEVRGSAGYHLQEKGEYVSSIPARFFMHRPRNVRLRVCYILAILTSCVGVCCVCLARLHGQSTVHDVRQGCLCDRLPLLHSVVCAAVQVVFSIEPAQVADLAPKQTATFAVTGMCSSARSVEECLLCALVTGKVQQALFRVAARCAASTPL